MRRGGTLIATPCRVSHYYAVVGSRRSTIAPFNTNYLGSIQVHPKICSVGSFRHFSSNDYDDFREKGRRRRASPTIREMSNYEKNKFARLKRETEHELDMTTTPGNSAVQYQLLEDWLILDQMLNHAYARVAIDYCDKLARKILENASTVKDGKFLLEVIRGWVKLAEPRKAESLMKCLMDAQTRCNSTSRPFHLLYASLISGFSADTSDKKALEAARYWADQLGSEKSLLVYNSLLNAYGTRGLAQEATDLLRNHLMKRLQPDVISYSSVMKAWARSNDRNAQVYIDQILEELKEAYHANGKPRFLRPNTYVYGIAMTLASPKRALALLQEMNDFYEQTKDPDLAPTTRHYVSTMRRLAEAGMPHEAERLLYEMQNSTRENLRPNYNCFTTVINAYAKQFTFESTEHAEQILYSMEKTYLERMHDIDINAYGYNIVMDAYSRTRNGGVSKVEAIIDRMKKVAEKTGNPAIAPDIISYTALIKAWCNEAKPGYIAKVENFLADLESRSQFTDIVIYGVVIDAVCKSGEADAGARGEAILRRMADRGIRPNRLCFNNVLSTYSREGRWQEAQSILDWMENESMNGNKAAKPNARDLTTCLWAFVRASERDGQHFKDALQLFKNMSDLYKLDKSFKPAPSTLTAILHVLANSKQVKGKASLVKEILGMANQMDIESETPSYNALLRACSTEDGTSEQKLEALGLAVRCYQVMRQRVATDASTYVSLMRCCNFISNQEEKVAALEDFLRECIEAGKVNYVVEECFRKLAPTSKMLEHSLHKETEPVRDMPSNAGQRKT